MPFLEALFLITSFDREFFSIILLSLRVSLSAAIIAFALAMPVAAFLAIRVFPGRNGVVAVINAFQGLPPVVVGLVLYLALSRSGPLGVLAALYTSELAPRKLREWLKPAIELLAGVPSVVLGFFALMVLASFMQDTFGLPTRLNALVAGLGLALAIVPVIFTVAEDALSAVPRSYREASLALGATRWETAWRVVLPAAAPGVLAACVLGLGRAIGETMVVLMASGNAAIVSTRLTDSTRTLSATIAAEMGEVVVGSPHYGVLFFIGVQLFLITFVLNLLAGSFARRVVRRLGGAV